MTHRPEIVLDSGITIYLDCLFQYRTYAGRMEGLPNRLKNGLLIDRVLRYAEEKLWQGGKPHLRAPREIPVPIPEGHWFRLDGVSEFVKIPPVASLATFEALMPAHDPDADCSSLKVVWFQDEYGLPVAAALLRQFQTLDWRALATDGSW